MTHIRELLAQPSFSSWEIVWGTGFAALDDLTSGGFRPGEVWLVTGVPGQGCTTLVSQWAAMLAIQHSVPTWLHCPREDRQHCVARLLASTGKLPLRDLMSGKTDRVEISGLDVAREALASSDLFVRTGRDASLPAWNDDIVHRALIVDDTDLANAVTPERLRVLGEQGALVVAALPRHLLVQGRHPDGDLHPEWARIADVIVEIRSRQLDEATPGARMGEAELTVLKFRRGPTLVTAVSFQGHYARFVDLA